LLLILPRPKISSPISVILLTYSPTKANQTRMKPVRRYVTKPRNGFTEIVNGLGQIQVRNCRTKIRIGNNRNMKCMARV